MRRIIITGLSFVVAILTTEYGETQETVTLRIEVREAVRQFGAEFLRFTGSLTAEFRAADSQKAIIEIKPGVLAGFNDPELTMQVSGHMEHMEGDERGWRVNLVFALNGSTRQGFLNESPFVHPVFPLSEFGACTDFLLCVVIRARPVEADLPLFFQRGDFNDDGIADVSDPVAILLYLFGNGVERRCLKAADTNDDGVIEITDAVQELAYLFLGTPTTAMPTAFCGVDLTEDDLRCDGSAVCEAALEP